MKTECKVLKIFGSFRADITDDMLLAIQLNHSTLGLCKPTYAQQRPGGLQIQKLTPT